jgi:hypothetical protein
MDQSIPHKHVVSETEFECMGMNLSPFSERGSQAASLQEESKSMVIGFDVTAGSQH